jgi:molecular chaperone GrpE
MGFVREEDVDSVADADPATETSAPVAVEGEIVEEEPEATEEEEEEIDELTALRQQLEAAQTQADDYLDDLRRERAAFQNFKKRQAVERDDLRQMAVAGTLVQVLPILDDLERALDAVPEDQSDQPWIEGITLIQRKLQTVLETVNVALVEAEPGQPFDPFVHEAVTHEEQEDYQAGEIIAVVQKGYKLGQRVLRPAMVRVAK